MNKKIVNGLWIGGSLSAMEQLTIRSFEAQGYTFRLWTYGEVGGVPSSVEIAPAAEVIPEEQRFHYKNANRYGHGKGSYAGFSDIFRYRLLYLYGGIWIDMDMTSLAPLPVIGEYAFRKHRQAGAVGNFLLCPKGSDLMEWCYEKAAASMNGENTDWMLPIRILNEGILRFGLGAHIVDTGHDDEFPAIAQLLRSGGSPGRHWVLIHWLNEEFRRIGIPKDVCLPGSALHRLCEAHAVSIRILEGKEARAYKARISRLHYLWLNVQARWNWYRSRN